MTHPEETQPDIPGLLARKSEADTAFEKSKDNILELKEFSSGDALVIGVHHVFQKMHAIASSAVVARALGIKSKANLLQRQVQLLFDVISEVRRGNFDPLKSHLDSMADKEDILAAQTNDSRSLELGLQYRSISQKIPHSGEPYGPSVK